MSSGGAVLIAAAMLFSPVGSAVHASCQGEEPVPVRVVSESGHGFDFLADPGQQIRFQQIAETGNTLVSAVPLEQIICLQLVQGAAGDDLTRIGCLIEGLASPEWKTRESSEAALRTMLNRTEVKRMLTDATRHELLEVRYRAARLLGTGSAGGGSSTRQFRYDVLITRDGTRRHGRAVGISLTGTRQGVPLRLEQREIQSLSRRVPVPAPAPAVKVDVSIRHRFSRSLPVLLDFQTGAGGQSLPVAAGISREYSPDGVLLDAEFPDERARRGGVVISSYSFSFENRPTGGNSACASRDANSLVRPHTGILRVQFCQPGEPFAPAGVTHVGLFAARIEHPMAILMQAFNADGQLLAEVQSSDERCCWFEVESPEPVCRVRMIANPLALQMDQPVDEDYAIDNLQFSPPVATLPIAAGETGLVRLRNGDLFPVGQVDPGAGSLALRVIAAGTGSLELAHEQVAWWIRPRSTFRQPEAGNPVWLAMLPDRSCLRVEWREGSLVNTRDGQPLDTNGLVALWSGQDWLRFPVAQDFDFGPRVLVFPAARIAVSDVTLDPRGIQWERDGSTALFQPLKVFQQDDVPEDPTGANRAVAPQLAPTSRGFPWDDVLAWNLPSVWFRPPPCAVEGAGVVSLTTGEQYSFGPGTLFQFKETTADGIRLFGQPGSTIEIPWAEVWRMAWPDSH